MSTNWETRVLSQSDCANESRSQESQGTRHVIKEIFTLRKNKKEEEVLIGRKNSDCGVKKSLQSPAVRVTSSEIKEKRESKGTPRGLNRKASKGCTKGQGRGKNTVRVIAGRQKNLNSETQRGIYGKNWGKKGDQRNKNANYRPSLDTISINEMTQDNEQEARGKTTKDPARS